MQFSKKMDSANQNNEANTEAVIIEVDENLDSDGHKAEQKKHEQEAKKNDDIEMEDNNKHHHNEEEGEKSSHKSSHIEQKIDDIYHDVQKNTDQNDDSKADKNLEEINQNEGANELHNKLDISELIKKAESGDIDSIKALIEFYKKNQDEENLNKWMKIALEHNIDVK